MNDDAELAARGPIALMPTRTASSFVTSTHAIRGPRHALTEQLRGALRRAPRDQARALFRQTTSGRQSDAGRAPVTSAVTPLNREVIR